MKRAKQWIAAAVVGVLVIAAVAVLREETSHAVFASEDDLRTGELPSALLQERLAQVDSNVVLLDVREPEEFSQGHIPGTKNLPLSGLEARLSELAKEAIVVTICRSGNRSAHAAALLRSAGFSRVLNMSGGMLSWQGPIE